jgi:hypothetical protein
MRLLMLAGALAVASVSRTASAQSLPNINGIKQTTNRAVAKTNAHTLAMTSVDSAANAAKAAASAPNGSTAGARRPADAPADTSRAHGVRAIAAGAATHPAAEMDTAGGRVVLRREVFSYEQSGRRDPFVSLMTVGELRPMISDLAISGILIDPTGRNSVAVLRDVSSKEQYRVKVGQQLGRMRVARITQKTVTFTIEEFGFSRQQELAMDDSNQARTK